MSYGFVNQFLRSQQNPMIPNQTPVYPIGAEPYNPGALEGQQDLYARPQMPDQAQEPSFIDQYKQMIMNQPRQATTDLENFTRAGTPDPNAYKPSKMRRLGAALMGGLAGLNNPEAGYSIAQGIVNKPYNEALGKHNIEYNRLRTLAGSEQNQNQDRIKQVQLLGQLDNTDKDNRRQLAQVDSQITHQREQEKAAQQRIELNTYKVQNPNAKFDFSGPTVLVADPGTGKIIDSKVPTGNLSDMDKINLNQQNAMSRIAAQGANSIATKNAGMDEIHGYDAEGNATVVYVPKNSQGKVDTGIATFAKPDLGSVSENVQTVNPDGTSKTSTTTRTPGSKVITTKGNTTGLVTAKAKVKMLDPTGKAMLLDESEVTEALKHGWVKR